MTASNHLYIFLFVFLFAREWLLRDGQGVVLLGHAEGVVAAWSKGRVAVSSCLRVVLECALRDLVGVCSSPLSSCRVSSSPLSSCRVSVGVEEFLSF